MKKYNFVYKTTLSNGIFYYGQHKTNNLDDGYIGSSRKLKQYIKEHPELEVKREIICYCDTQDELNKMEKFYIPKDYKTNPLCFNDNKACIIYENGMFCGHHHTTESKKRQSEQTKGENNPMYGKSSWEGWTGEKLEDRKRRYSESMKGKNKDRIFVYKGTEQRFIKPDELELYLSLGYLEGFANRKSIKGCMWITKNGENKVLLPENINELEFYLNNGWRKGQTKHKPAWNKGRKTGKPSPMKGKKTGKPAWNAGGHTMYKNDIKTFVRKCDLEKYLLEGWEYKNDKL